ncbi:hypothetical protein [Polyangium spumosum]|uniref:Uncharacterized protein n=1 Tax=Polyangium spumosum TaxID=889282 RepID=A0A6N7Q037_9BACT|nr:hypothetical protein [Polyangium spumosum]MRG97832.1 hypothetical protein [Polyangium spumosum]
MATHPFATAEAADEDAEPTLVAARVAEPPPSGIRASTPPGDDRDTLFDPACIPPNTPIRRAARFLLWIPVSLWRALRRFGQRLAERLDPPPLRTLLPPPPPLHRGALRQDDLGEHLLNNLFRISPAYVRAAVHVSRLVQEIQSYPAQERLTWFAHFALSRMCATSDGPVPIAWIRARMPEALRSEVTRALEQLEEEGIITLLSRETEDPAVVAGGISNAVRGRLTHAELLRDL